MRGGRVVRHRLCMVGEAVALDRGDDVVEGGADGAITDGATGVNVTGTAIFTTLNDAGAAITIDNTANDFGAVAAEALNAAGAACAAS